ncbi:hypothetical protein [Patiriisocius hiemis]|uniref:Uncharacterized protein n=1 Tax=Patiriisocius hiemis TaxID=3075604 RepID=A0ABU2Y8F3_9FLAO|nr:hypothetical protein [Constantimarinum sp. W242]MDT0554465.1 hypothetical protein [Constantimarinum sp. W242]
MEQIKIIFFALTSFFGIEDGKIAADKTTITIYPENKEIEIIQEDLFSIIQTEKDSLLVLDQWNKLLDLKKGNTTWSKELDSFPVKSFDYTSIKNTIKPHLILSYSKEEDLRNLGIWYNENKNQFSINHIPQHNTKTSDGSLKGNYWVFNGESKFSFTIEPFLQMPEKYQKLKRPLKKLTPTIKKEE